MPKTKIFCDIADSKTIKEFNKKPIVDGFTTNPSLMRKAGAKSYEKYSKLLLKICRKKPISLEVFADNFTEMEKQALKINSWGKNIYVKIPVINSKGKFAGQLIKNVAEVTEKLGDLQEKMRKLKEVPNNAPKNVTNALFVGSTKELQTMLKDKLKDENN